MREVFGVYIFLIVFSSCYLEGAKKLELLVPSKNGSTAFVNEIIIKFDDLSDSLPCFMDGSIDLVNGKTSEGSFFVTKVKEINFLLNESVLNS